MMRGVWLGSATRQSLFPSLPLYQFPAPPCRVQCCAAVDAKKLVDLEYAELELNDIQVCFLSFLIYSCLMGSNSFLFGSGDVLISARDLLKMSSGFILSCLLVDRSLHLNFIDKVVAQLMRFMGEVGIRGCALMSLCGGIRTEQCAI